MFTPFNCPVAGPSTIALAPAPTRADRLICRLRVRGRRQRIENGYAWECDGDAQAALASVATAWCRQLGERASYALSKGTIGRIPYDYRDNPVDGLLEAMTDEERGRLVGVVGDDF